MTQHSAAPTLLQQLKQDPLDAVLRVANVPIWLAASIPFAILFLVAPVPWTVSRFFVYAPQYLFGFALISRMEGNDYVYLFSQGTAALACVALWTAVAIGHAAITRRWNLILAFCTALVTVVVVGWLVNLGFAYLGYPIFLDGP